MYVIGYLPLEAYRMTEKINGVNVLAENGCQTGVIRLDVWAHKKTRCMRKKLRCLRRVVQQLEQVPESGKSTGMERTVLFGYVECVERLSDCAGEQSTGLEWTVSWLHNGRVPAWSVPPGGEDDFLSHLYDKNIRITITMCVSLPPHTIVPALVQKKTIRSLPQLPQPHGLLRTSSTVNCVFFCIFLFLFFML